VKRLIAAILVISLVAAAISIGTWALFSDYEQSLNNTFTAGSLDLKVNGLDDPDTETFFEIECMQPGDEGLVQILLENVGCVDGVADIHLKNLIDHENEVIEPEAEGCWYDTGPSCAPDTTAGAEEGELSQYLEMRITADMDQPNDGVFETVVVPLGNLTDIDCINYIYGDLPAESSIGLQIEWFLPANIGNIIQTDSVSFDIEFSLNQKVGEVTGVVTDVAQAAEVYTNADSYDFDVTVHNEGTITGNFWVNAEIQTEGGQTVWAGSAYATDVDPCSSTTLSFSAPVPATAGNYVVVANPGGYECPFVVSDPPLLQVTNIDQPQMVQICEELTVTVTITNNGGVPNLGGETAIVAAVFTDYTILAGPLPMVCDPIAPGASQDFTVNLGHVGENWNQDPMYAPAFLVVGAFDIAGADAYTCPVAALNPPDVQIVGIQQPAVVQPCENITIGVDLHNLGDKPGMSGDLIVTVQDATGAPVLGPTTVQPGLLDPCVTTKVEFGPLHIEEAWALQTLTVIAELDGQTETCSIEVAGPPNIQVVGFDQPDEVAFCEEVMIGVVITNTGAKPGTEDITLEINGQPVGTQTPNPVNGGETVTVWFGPFHAGTDIPVGTNNVTTVPGGPPHDITVNPPPPIPPVSTSWTYAVDFVCADFGLNEVDHLMDYHVAAQDVMPDTTECRPCTDTGPGGLCEAPFPWEDWDAPPQVSSYHLDVDTNYGPNQFGDPPQRVMALFGQNMMMQLQKLDVWKSMTDCTEVFEKNYMLPPVPGFLCEFEMATFPQNTSGDQPGWPYDPVPSERWSAVWDFGGKVAAGTIFTGCVPPWPFWISCHVVGAENIVVPAYPGGIDTIHIYCDMPFGGDDDDEDARDHDADGYVTGQELRDGSDPNDASSVPGGPAESPTLWIDEDGPDGVDNDGDGAVDEDQPGEDSDSDGVWDEDGDDTHPNDPGYDDDDDGYVDEDAPASGPPPANGTRDIWFDNSTGKIVKQIWVNAPYWGTETSELVTPVP
jgi:predicted ribosomally synthesized peptide with SipW-like signal peptide